MLGIGNPDRGDDALGLAAVERLREDPPAGARLETARGDMVGLLERFGEAETVILVDAVQAGQEPGSLLSFEAGDGELKPGLANFASSHSFNLAEAIELARSLGKLPPRLIVHGVEGASYDFGEALSPAVAEALEPLVERIREDCRA